MSTQLKASLLLQLDGQGKLNDGLAKFQKQLEQLRDIAKTLGLTELEDGLDQLRGSSGTVDALTDGLRGVERQADRTGAAIKRLVQAANDNVIRVNSQGGAFGTGTRGGLMVIPGGGGGRGGGGASDVPFGSPLLLTGPGGDGGIPINLRGSSRSLAAGAALLGAGRGVGSAASRFGSAASNAISGGFSAALEGFAIYEPIKQFAERDAQLRQIGVMEGLQGAALEQEIGRLNKLINEDALGTGNKGGSVAEAYHDLLGQGIAKNLVEGVLRAHSEAATAYHIAPELLGNVTGSIVKNLGITGQADAEGALAAVAYATQHGRVKMEDFSRSLPGLTGTAASLGMTGRGGLNTLLAGTELAANLASDGTQAGYNFDDLLSYITSNREDNVTRKRAHLDLPALLKQGEKRGISAFDVYINAFRQMTAGKSPVEQAEVIGKLVGNKQARNGLLAILQHYEAFKKLREEVGKVDALKLKIDFASVFKSPATQILNTGEALSQLSQALGQGFLPVLTWLNLRLLNLVNGFGWLNTRFPETTHLVLAIVAGMLALAAAITVIGVVVPVFTAGWAVLVASLTAFGAVLTFLLSPIGLIIAAIGLLGLAAYEIYEHWSSIGPFFEKLWEGAKGTFNWFLTWVEDWAARMGGIIMHGIAAGFHDGVNGSINLLEHLAPAGSGFERFLEHEKLPQLQPPGAGGAQSLVDGPQHTIGGVITVQAAPGTAITGAQGSNPRVPLVVSQAPNAGPVLSRH